MLYLSVGIISLFVLSFWANNALARALPFNVRLFLLFPGVVIHELSHAIICYLTGTPVKEIKLFSSSGGYVAHEAPNSRITQFFISTSPLIIGTLVIYITLKALEPAINLTQIGLTGEWFMSHRDGVGGMLSSLIFIPKNWLCLWIIISVILTFTPSAQDVRLALTGLISLLILAAIFAYNKWEPAMVGSAVNLVFGLAVALILITLFAYFLTAVSKITGSVKIK